MQEQEGATLLVSAKFAVVSVRNIYLQFQEVSIFTYTNMPFTTVGIQHINRCWVFLLHDARFLFSR